MIRWSALALLSLILAGIVWLAMAQHPEESEISSASPTAAAGPTVASSVPDNEEIADISSSPRHLDGALEKSRSKAKQRERERLQERSAELREQLEALGKLEGQVLYEYAAGLENPGNAVAGLLPEFIETKGRVEGMKANGLGSVHPSMKSAANAFGEVRARLDLAVTTFRATLRAEQDQITVELAK